MAARTKKKSNKSALIKGASDILPRDLLNEPAFKVGLQKLMRGYSGLYLLYRRRRLYYIGLAKNLYWRLSHHTQNRHANRWDGFRVFRVDRVRYLKDIETLLLWIATPPGNRVNGRFHRDADLTRVLRTIQKEQYRRLARIKKALA